MLPFLRRCARHKIVEDVEIALARRCASNAALLKVVVQSLDTTQATAFRELELCVLSKARRVRVEKRPSVSEGLQNELGGRNLALELGSFLSGAADTKLDDGLDGEPSALGFATARLSTTFVSHAGECRHERQEKERRKT